MAEISGNRANLLDFDHENLGDFCIYVQTWMMGRNPWKSPKLYPYVSRSVVSNSPKNLHGPQIFSLGKRDGYNRNSLSVRYRYQYLLGVRYFLRVFFKNPASLPPRVSVFGNICVVSFYVCGYMVKKKSNYCTRFGAAIAAYICL